MPPNVIGYVFLTLSFEREGNKWVGACLELGTSTFARTLKATQEELTELVTAHLNALEEVGERENFFTEWGIVIHPTLKPPSEFTIKGSGDHWARLFRSNVEPSGLFLRPRPFPLEHGTGSVQERELAGV